MTLRRARRTLLATTAASTALLAAACGPDVDTLGPAPATPTPSAGSAPAEAPTSFRPGEYEATGSYQTPGGLQSVDVEVTLAADGTITDVEVDGNADGGNSRQFQRKFEGGIDAEVEGRKITELDIDKVSGSSLTSGGFNDAIAQIINDARS